MNRLAISKTPVINGTNFLNSLSLITNSFIDFTLSSWKLSKINLNTSLITSFGIFSKLCYIKLNNIVIKDGFSNILSTLDFLDFIIPFITSNAFVILYLTNFVGNALCYLLNELTNNSIKPNKSFMSFNYGISSKNPVIIPNILWKVI